MQNQWQIQGLHSPGRGLIEAVTYLFEPDEEGRYRVWTESGGKNAAPVTLLQAVAEKLAKLDTTAKGVFPLMIYRRY